jgi:dethiobiotin synthetase
VNEPPFAGRGRIVLVGTGTGIGKTHLGVALVKALADAGAEVAGLKPVESGVGSGISDTERLAAVGTFHVKQPPPYVLAAPVSPHLAAPQEGMTIRLGPIVRWVDSVEAAWVVVETAGGLLSPLAPGLTNLDLAEVLEPTAVILVAPDRLGVLHDVTAALFALRVLAPRLPEAVVALQAPAEADASTGGNAWELLALEIARSVVMFPRAEAAEESTQVVARALMGMLVGDLVASPTA